MGIQSIDHVQLTMPPLQDSEDRARGFYGDVLGMKEIERPPGALRKLRTVWFRSGTAELHITEEADFRPARKGHPALVTDDLDELAQRCEESRLAVTWDQRYPGMRRFYVLDPFGNRLEVMQPDTNGWDRQEG